MIFVDKLILLRKKAGWSQEELADQMNVTRQSVSKWEGAQSVPDLEKMLRLSELFGVSTDYLLGCAPAPITSAVAAADGPREFPIPIIGTVRAGFGAFAFEEDYGEEYARIKDPGSYFYLLVKGDSMEPRISDGDLALVHRQPTLENGDLGVVIFGEGEGTLKKFIRRGNTIILQPFNNVYAPQIIMGEDLEHLYIAGKVVETRARW